MEKKINSAQKIFDNVGLGALVVCGGATMTEKAYEQGQKIAPIMQEYIGSIGSEIVEYGLPTFIMGASIMFSYKAFKALNRRQVDQS